MCTAAPQDGSGFIDSDEFFHVISLHRCRFLISNFARPQHQARARACPNALSLARSLAPSLLPVRSKQVKGAFAEHDMSWTQLSLPLAQAAERLPARRDRRPRTHPAHAAAGPDRAQVPAIPHVLGHCKCVPPLHALPPLFGHTLPAWLAAAAAGHIVYNIASKGCGPAPAFVQPCARRWRSSSPARTIRRSRMIGARCTTACGSSTRTKSRRASSR